MIIKVWRIDPRAKLPERSTAGSVGYDLFSLEETVIEPKGFALIRTGLVVKAEPPYALFVFPRSSLFRKKNLIMPNSAGIIDFDYCGERDEIKIPVFNLGEEATTIQAYERIAQAVFIMVASPKLIEGDPSELAENSRGGFGSTGGYK